MRYFLIAGEASGDRLGGALMAGLRELDARAQFDGVGGAAMQAQGLTSRFAMEELSVMGIAEVLPRYFDLKRLIRETAQAVITTRPDALITIDSPDFCLRVARLVREAGLRLPIIHYVAPSVWAWRPGRAAKMARWVDHVLAILPFEPPLMEATGMSCDFVGHPVVTEPRATEAEADAFRARMCGGPQAPVDPPDSHQDAFRAPVDGGPLILCLPGSRRGEIARLAPRFAQTLGLLSRDLPDLRVVLPTLPHLEESLTALDWPIPARIITDPQDKRAAFAAADLSLAASGTVSLELAANDVPMVIGYDMAPVSRFIIRRLLRVRTVTLVNLVSETQAVPEFLGRACQPENMAPALHELATIPAFADAQRRAMALTMTRLGAGGEPPGLRAARSVQAAIARISG
ncbi:MAG: lipid-A-disaccharide synthase [Paracoccus sp. (in: a-proteobacteria)]|nr:lipid-A-disaccharide synthase [Paracoccus sp. (in: a-proteobacteria)]